MRPLQAYDHLFIFTSVSEDHTVTTDQPIGQAHTHQLRNAPPSASQRRVGGQHAGDFLVHASKGVKFKRDR